MSKLHLDFTVVVIVASAFLAGFLAPIIAKRNDTPAEQAAERIIKTETGIEYDFSPDDADANPG